MDNQKKILLLGAGGQLGRSAKQYLARRYQLISKSHQELDITATDKLISLINEVRPDIIFNASAYTQVDTAESEPEVANIVNGKAPGVLAEQTKKLNALLIHVSTDYVFDGEKGALYHEEDNPSPLNQYGHSKLLGENNIKVAMENQGRYFIFRTSWLYSRSEHSFVGKVLKWSESNGILKIVDDQIGSPTWATSFAQIISNSIAYSITKGKDWERENAGIYHLTGQGACSRFELAKEIIKHHPSPNLNKVNEIKPAKTSDFQTAAIRPKNSSLNNSKFNRVFNQSLSPWEVGLKACLTSDD